MGAAPERGRVVTEPAPCKHGPRNDSSIHPVLLLYVVLDESYGFIRSRLDLSPPQLRKQNRLHFVRSQMAPLLAPVRTELLLEFPKLAPCYGNRWRSRPAAEYLRSGCHRRDCRKWKRDFKIAAATVEGFSSRDGAAEDYYAVLGLMPDASPLQIKKAYYNCMKSCHPDLSGNDPDVTNFCMFINEVYAVLSDPVQRMVYDEIHGHAAMAMNPFLDDSAPKDCTFVDEFCCIGCKNCANVAPDVFKIEEDFGRARVCSQSGNFDLVQEAMDTCPVDCIHWTSAAQLSLLEDEMHRVERVNVGLMLAGMGSSSMDVFRMASSRWEKRQAKVLEKAKMQMMKQRDSDKSGFTSAFWSNIWGSPKNFQSREEEVKARAAAAAKRWREHSRKGADRPPAFELPEAMSKQGME